MGERLNQLSKMIFSPILSAALEAEVLIHYVDDSAADIVALKRTLRDEKAVKISSSERIDQISSFDNYKSTDVFIVDIMRPDSISLERDVESIRGFTDAPVVFLTGQADTKIDERAHQAGAHAVLRKDRLDAKHLIECLERACELHLRWRDPSAREDVADRDDRPISSDHWPMLEPTLAANDEALAYIAFALDRISNAATVDSDEVLGRAHGLVRFMRQIGNRHFSNSVLMDASNVLEHVFEALSPDIRARRANVSLEILGNAPFWSVGSRQDAEYGMRALVESAVHLCEPDHWMEIAVGSFDGLARIDISSQQALVSGYTDFFETTARPSANPSYGLALMRCAVHLLALRHEQIILSKNVVNRISFFI